MKSRIYREIMFIIRNVNGANVMERETHDTYGKMNKWRIIVNDKEREWKELDLWWDSRKKQFIYKLINCLGEKFLILRVKNIFLFIFVKYKGFLYSAINSNRGTKLPSKKQAFSVETFVVRAPHVLSSDFRSICTPRFSYPSFRVATLKKKKHLCTRRDRFLQKIAQRVRDSDIMY